MTADPVLLIVAKAPVAGFAKTRLAVDVGTDAAADLAAASLLDTLSTARSTGWAVVVAMTGDLSEAARRAALEEALTGVALVPQEGATFSARLAAAHASAMRVCRGRPVMQIGTDTPQASVDDLAAAQQLLSVHGSVLGPALDGGWWLLGLTDPTRAACLVDVPMSRGDTGQLTSEALQARGCHVALTTVLQDVDGVEDAERVAGRYPELRFAAAWRAHRSTSS